MKKIIHITLGALLVFSCSEDHTSEKKESNEQYPESHEPIIRDMPKKGLLDLEYGKEYEVFYYIVKSERIAMNEANIQCPPTDEKSIKKNVELTNQLIKEGHTQVMNRFRISEDSFYLIVDLAFENSWQNLPSIQNIPNVLKDSIYEY